VDHISNRFVLNLRNHLMFFADSLQTFLVHTENWFAFHTTLKIELSVIRVNKIYLDTFLIIFHPYFLCISGTRNVFLPKNGKSHHIELFKNVTKIFFTLNVYNCKTLDYAFIVCALKTLKGGIDVFKTAKSCWNMLLKFPIFFEIILLTFPSDISSKVML
jgi:hypothetical protein